MGGRIFKWKFLPVPKIDVNNIQKSSSYAKLFREKIAVYSENNMKDVNTIAKMWSALMVKHVVHTVATLLYMIS